MSKKLTTAVLALAILVLPAAASATHVFSDVSDTTVFEADIDWLAATGVTLGCNPPANTEFCPGDGVTRGQIAAFLHRLATSGVVDAGSVAGMTGEELLDAPATGRFGPVGAALAEANLATAAYQDAETAVAAGYLSTLDTLGCFENPGTGGMGLHYLNESLLDGTVDATSPEALVYELDYNGDITGLVAHEYIVPVDAWTGDGPPSLFGRAFHQHPVLPLWILHTWIWKDNPAGTFADWNPKVRLCPEGLPVFGEDLP
jgi:hypothetical protein